MTRKLFLIVYKSPLFPAHWSLWIPSLADPNIGKRIHVTGDVYSGFEHEFVRNYNLENDTRTQVSIMLGEVDDKHVVDDEDSPDLKNDDEERDQTPRDRIEEIALEVPAPGPSMNSASTTTTRDAVRSEMTFSRSRGSNLG